MLQTTFYLTQLIMLCLGLICFITLYFVPAGYGKMISKKWGASFNNKAAWILMEFPSLITMPVLFALSPHKACFVRIIVSFFFVFHYVHRTLIFPFLLRGKSKMPVIIVLMGMIFNTVNSLLIGGWIFYFSPENAYPISWLYSPHFMIGSFLFICGMIINMQSDKYIRSLRTAEDTNHYFPSKGLYKYVTSANYFGEILEWSGFAILSWNTASALFVFWTATNLVPRAHTINKKYKEDFPEEMKKFKPKRIFPFIY